MEYLNTSYFFDFEEAAVQHLLADYKDDSISDKDKAIGLYTMVRDGWKYDPYTISLARESYRASCIAKKDTGNCVEKSIVLIACLRAVGIPARLHLGKVKNHIAVERLTKKFGTNELTPHGMVNAYIGNKWLKMSPAFNKSLCKKFNVEPLAFDGEHNSFLQQYNRKGNRFMEYIDDYGYFDDVPLEFMKQNIRQHYPTIFDKDEQITEFKL